MFTELTFDLPIGTMLVFSDGFSHELGQICDIETTKWGKHYVVVMADGRFEAVHSIEDNVDRRIGFAVASPEWIARLRD